jgi:glycosyltransferase involved in cell wall biosynthesis
MIDSKERLAFFLPALYGGGAERIFLNLASGFAQKGFNVDLVLAEATGPFLADVPRSVNVVELHRKRLAAMRTIAGIPALVRYLRQARPSVLVSALQANVVALWAKWVSKIPLRVVISEHNTFTHQIRQFPRGMRWLVLGLTRGLYPWADKIIAVSKGVADDLANAISIPVKSIQVIYNPVVTSEIRAKAAEPCHHPWFLDQEVPVILSIGRLTEQKDFETLIHAFAVVRRYRKTRLVILGEGEKRHSLESMIRNYRLQEDVLLPGFVANPYAYMKQSSLFVLSSKWEGLPTVLIEALYCGARIIATDCPNGPREILCDGLYGDLVPVGCVTDLAQAIENGLRVRRIKNSDECWMPYEYETIISQYMTVLFGK